MCIPGCNSILVRFLLNEIMKENTQEFGTWQDQNMFYLVARLMLTAKHFPLHSGKVPMGNKPLALSDSVTQITK